MALQPIWITDDAPPEAFPDVESALTQPNGLLAVGGDLRPQRLVSAYRRGIFPWYSDGQPILWWAPDPRAVLWPHRLHVSRSLRKTLRSAKFEVTRNHAFVRLIRACAGPRGTQHDTWITGEMMRAYCALADAGYAHSIECWHEGRLAGGLYGVAIGRVFYGESMFSRVADASKTALTYLCAQGFALIDCQLPSPHLKRMGSEDMPRTAFCEALDRFCNAPPIWLPSVRSAPLRNPQCRT
ncbi:MAG: leucyl/phenylalanyl-tRNA--protein transferase [Gammaproteobacteria bacterium]